MRTSESAGELAETREYGELRRVVIDWLDDNYHFGDAEALIGADDRSFLDHGILASLGFVQLIVYLEDKYRITIDRKDLTRENFDSMAKIVTYVLRHREFRGVA
jgi:acyl carrier protein